MNRMIYRADSAQDFGGRGGVGGLSQVDMIRVRQVRGWNDNVW